MAIAESDFVQVYLCPTPGWRRGLSTLWTVCGLGGLFALAWAEPFSHKLFAAALRAGFPERFIRFVGEPVVMAVRGVLVVEAFGYIYHRYFQHVGALTRRSQVLRRNQMYHWVHHMIIYPIGRVYKKALPYVSSEEGIAWSWVIPAVLAIGAALWFLGPRLGTFVFISAIVVYAKAFVEKAHERFHVAEHPWMHSPYFHWLEDIHILHHWDQRTNFTIIHPLMDILFGTYLDPRTHQREIRMALEDEDLTVSDLINWRYLLKEASPAEYAAFISQARRHPRSVRKLTLLIGTLREWSPRHPQDEEARDLESRAADLYELVRPRPLAAPVAA